MEKETRPGPGPEKTNSRQAGKTVSPAVLWGAVLLLAALALLTYLNTKITLYSDDYWYGTFFDRGFGEFLEEMKQHYLTTNGRLYIHVIVPTVLLFDTKLFAVLSPVLLALLCWAGARFLDSGLSAGRALAPAALGMFLILAWDVEYLRASLLWISAYFNYIFPVCMLALAAWFQRRWYQGGGQGWHIPVLLFALLAGASTEQSGAMSLVVIWGYAILSRVWGGVTRRRCWGFPLMALLGFLTILLAPGSWARVDRGIEGGILSFLSPEVFLSRFYDAMIYVVEYPSSVVLLAALDLLCAILALLDKQLPRGLLAGFPLAAGQALCFFLGLEFPACVVAAVTLLYLAVCFLLRKEYWETGLMLFASLAGHMILVVTGLGSERTSVAGLLAMTLVIVSLLRRVLEYAPEKAETAAFCAAAVVCAAVAFPTLQGYTESKKVVDANLAAVEESRGADVCTLSIDIDPRYRFTMFFEGYYFYENFKKYYGIPGATQLRFTSDKWKVSQVCSSDNTYLFPAIEDQRGLFLPTEFTLSAAGGKASWDWKTHTYHVSIDEKNFLVTEEGQVYQCLEDGSQTLLGEDLPVIRPFSSTYTLLYFPAEQMREYFGLSWQYDSAGNSYLIQKAE